MAVALSSDRFALPFLAAGQAQKEITHNEALTLIDVLLHMRAEEVGRSVPPEHPVVGQCWVIAEDSSGEWNGKGNWLACYTSGGWRFVAPQPGMRITSVDASESTGRFWIYDGAQWVLCPAQMDGLYIGGKHILGGQGAHISVPAGGTVIDVEARSKLTQILALLEGHGLIEAE
ncbi:MAG: DUF2793 domain-containing protein [Sphingobium sp.]|nr:DUF2793 domain-containing protein [Sphingobium sp.]